MDILELKGVNSRMKASSSSVQCVNPVLKPKKRRPPKESFCEFDIIENFNKQHRRRRKRYSSETAELCTRIQDVAERNERIHQIYSARQSSQETLNSADAKLKKEEANKRSHMLTMSKTDHSKSPDSQRPVVLSPKICQNCSGQIEDKILSGISTPTNSAKKHVKRKSRKLSKNGDLQNEVKNAQESLKHLITVYENLNNTGLPRQNVTRSSERRDSSKRSDGHRSESKNRENYPKIIEKPHEKQRREVSSLEKKLRIEQWQENVNSARSRSQSKEPDRMPKKEEIKVTERNHCKREKNHDFIHRKTQTSRIPSEERRASKERSFDPSVRVTEESESVKQELVKQESVKDIIVEKPLKPCLSMKLVKEVKFCDRSAGDDYEEAFSQLCVAEVEDDSDKEVHLRVENFDENLIDENNFKHRNYKVDIKDTHHGKREIRLLDEPRTLKEPSRVYDKDEGRKIMNFLGKFRSRSRSPKKVNHFRVPATKYQEISVNLKATNKLETVPIAAAEEQEFMKLSRKELSFSNLNLSPINLHYMMHSTDQDFPEEIEVKTALPELKEETKKTILKHPVRNLETRPKLSRTALALRDIFKVNELQKIRSVCVSNNFRSPRKNDRSPGSESTPAVYKQDVGDIMTRNVFGKNKFHTTKTVLPTERIVEISSKIFRDQKVSFTVEGVEPPKRFQVAAKNKVLRDDGKLTMQIFAGLEVIKDDLSSMCHGRKKNQETEDPNFDSLEKSESSPRSELEKPMRVKKSSLVSLKCKRYKPQRKESQRSHRHKKPARKKTLEHLNHFKKVDLIDSETQTDLEVIINNNRFNEILPIYRESGKTDSIMQTLSHRSVAIEADLDKDLHDSSICQTIADSNFECTDCKILMNMLSPGYKSHIINLHRNSKSESNILKQISNSKVNDDSNKDQSQDQVKSLLSKSKSVSNLQSSRNCYVSRIPKLQIPRKIKPVKENEMCDKITLKKQYTTNEIAVLETCLNNILEKLADGEKIAPLISPRSKSKSVIKKMVVSPRRKSASGINTNRPKKYTHRKPKKVNNQSSNSVSTTVSSSSIPTVKSVYKNGKEMTSSVTTLCSNCSDSCYPKTKSSVSVQIANIYYEAKKVSDEKLKRESRIYKKNKSNYIKRKMIAKRRSKGVLQDFKRVVTHNSNIMKTVSSSCSPSKRHSSSSKKLAGPRDMGVISKEPFFIHNKSNICKSTARVSVDSLEMQCFTAMCPLTDIFNFSPPTYAYNVYNTEVQTIKPPPIHPNLTSFRETAMGNTRIIFNETKNSEALKQEAAASVSPKVCEMIKVNASEMSSFSNAARTCNNLIFNYSEKQAENAFEDTCDAPRGLSEETCNHNDSNATIPNLLSNESSGYESCRSQKTNSIKSFFRKSGGLLEMFKSTSKTRKASQELNMIQEQNSVKSVTSVESEPTRSWFGKIRKSSVKLYKDQKEGTREFKHQTLSECCRHKSTQKSTKCPCAVTFEKQVTECQKYAEKVIMESNLRKEGYLKQYNDFKELPLDILMGKRMCRGGAKCGCTGMPVAIQTMEAKEVDAATSARSDSSIAAIKGLKSSLAMLIPDDKVEEPEVSLSNVTKFEDLLENQISENRSSLNIEMSNINLETPNLSLRDDSFESAGPSQRSSQEDKEGEKRSSNTSKLSDKEMFDKLLHNYEKKDNIAKRLSEDDQFFEDQVSIVQSVDSKEDIKEIPDITSQERIPSRGPRFSDKSPTQKNECTVQADDIGTCFARGFRPDNLMLSGDACFNLNKQDKIKMSPHMLKNTESIIDFSERETPLDFLLALGFMVDEASNALKDDDIRSRLLAAITEARVWINKITTTQGTLLYLVAYKARPETMRYFLQLVEAIINKRINNAIKLDGFLRVLEQVEDGKIQMINILGEDKFEDEENEEKIVKKQLKHLFINVYSIAEKESTERKKELNRDQINLLRILVAKYRAGLHPHLELIARYIGQGLLDTEVQLEAAMIFLSRLDTAEVKLKEFENYCGISCDVDDKLRHQQ